MRAHPLTEQIPGERDGSGRVIGDAFLRAPAAAGIFVTGDTVKAATDDLGNHNLMTCQHAMSLGAWPATMRRRSWRGCRRTRTASRSM